MLKRLTVITLSVVGMFAVMDGALSQVAEEPLITVDPTIEVGTNATVDLFASNPTDVDFDALSFTLIVGDFAEALAGTTVGPEIASVTPAGLTAGAVSFFADIDSDPSTPPIVESPFAVIGTFSSFAVGDATISSTPATILTLGFDTTSLSVGDTFELSLAGGVQSSSIAIDGTQIELDFPDAFTITVVGDTAAVPEPSSCVLFTAVSGVMLLRRRKR